MWKRPPDLEPFGSSFEHEGIEVLGPALDFTPSLVGSPVHDHGDTRRFQCDMTNEDDDYFPSDEESEYDYSDSEDPFEFADPCEFSSRPVLLHQIRSCDDDAALAPLITSTVTALLKKVCNLHGSAPARKHFASLPAPHVPSNVHGSLNHYVNEELLGIRLCLDDHDAPRELALLLGIPTRSTWIAAVRAAFPPLPTGTRILDLKPVHYDDAGKRILGRLCPDDFLDTGNNEHCYSEFSSPVEKLDVGLPVHPTSSDVVSPTGTCSNDCGTNGNQPEGQPTLTSDALRPEITAPPESAHSSVSTLELSELDGIQPVDYLAMNPGLLPTDLMHSSPLPGNLSPSDLNHTVFGPTLLQRGIPTQRICGLTDNPFGSDDDDSPPPGERLESSPPDLSRPVTPLRVPLRFGSQLVPFDRGSIDACVELPRQPTHSSRDHNFHHRSSIPLELEHRSDLDSRLKNFLDNARSGTCLTRQPLLAQPEHPRERPAPLPGPIVPFSSCYLLSPCFRPPENLFPVL
jgi:hypothetical protein